jgi:hypothetical protein
MSKHLFIGGHADGEWREVEGDRPDFSVAKPIQSSGHPGTMLAFDRAEYAITVYRRELFRANKMEIIFYVEKSLPIEVAFEMLIAGYRKV